MSEILRWSAVETVERLKARDVSAVEVTTTHLARLDAVNPDINAIVDRVPDALDMARDIDEGRRAPGVLHGAPITTKINADQVGLVNTNGFAVLANNVSPDDSAVVANLRREGAVILGRTNTPEMSLRWCTSNPHHGTTLNPWNANITPGGSSGGASASLASGIGVIAHGNDLGGSVRYPAYCCGLAGLKPSRGRVPAYNPSAPKDRPEMTMAFSVQGPLGRSVADVKLGLSAMRGFHPGDANWTAAPANGRTRAKGPLRVGIVHDPFDAATHPAVKRSVDKAAAAAEAAGMEVSQCALPEAERVAEIWGQLLFTETEMMYGAFLRDNGSENLLRWIGAFTDYFECLDLNGYMGAMAERARLQRLWATMWDDIDFLIMPTSLIPPFENDLDFNDPSKAPDIIAAQKPLCVVNTLGLPALAIPTHVEDGIPLGIQIMGPMHDDDAVLEAGLQIEAALDAQVINQMPGSLWA